MCETILRLHSHARYKDEKISNLANFQIDFTFQIVGML